MKYDDLIEFARSQSPAPHPGPDTMQLLAAHAPPTATPRRSPWFWAGAVAAVAAAAAVLWLGALSVVDQTPPDPARSQALRVGEAQRTSEAVEVEVRIPERAPARTPPPAVPEPDMPAVEVEAQDGSQDEPEPRPRPAKPEPTAEELYDRAESQMAGGRLAAARGTLRRLVTKYPDYSGRAAAWIDWARLEERGGNSQKAACIYDSFLRSHGNHPLAADARHATTRLSADPDVDLRVCR